MADSIETEYAMKVDCDVLMEDTGPYLQKWMFDQDLVGQPWGYTRGCMVQMADAWMHGLHDDTPETEDRWASVDAKPGGLYV